MYRKYVQKGKIKVKTNINTDPMQKSNERQKLRESKGIRRETLEWQREKYPQKTGLVLKSNAEIREQYCARTLANAKITTE